MNSPEINLRDPRTIKIVVAVLLFVGLNYVYFFSNFASFLYSPMKTEIKAKREQYKAVAIKVAEAKKATQDLVKLEKELELLHAEWEVALASLPEKKEIASLLRRVTLAGERAGVRFQLFEPKPVIFHGVYDEHPVSVKIEGGFHEIGSFFSRIGNMERILHVTGIALEGEQNDEEQQVVRGQMTVSAFTVPTQQPPNEGDDGKGAKGKTKKRPRTRGNSHGTSTPDDSDE